MPRIAEPFELFEEDFLPERPARWDTLALEIDPPNWAVGAITKQGGRRQLKRQRVQECSVVPYRPGAYNGVFGPQPSPDDTAAYRKSLDRRVRKKGSAGKGAHNLPSVRSVVPRGNLREDDYRFWKGYVTEHYDKDNAQCRWCGILVHSRQEMQEHGVGGHCKQYLLALYRYAHRSAKNLRYCFACKTLTGDRHWGIPLCNRSMCWGRWKFNYNQLLAGFQHYRNWADEQQYRDPKNGPFADLPPEDDTEIGGVSC